MAQKNRITEVFGSQKVYPGRKSMGFFQNWWSCLLLNSVTLILTSESTFIKYDGESTPMALSFTISDLSVGVRIGYYATNRLKSSWQHWFWILICGLHSSLKMVSSSNCSNLPKVSELSKKHSWNKLTKAKMVSVDCLNRYCNSAQAEWMAVARTNEQVVKALGITEDNKKLLNQQHGYCTKTPCGTGIK